MIYPHRIRLRGPWECVPLEAFAGGILPMPRRVTMPGSFGDHGLAAFAGRVRYVRHFGYPGRIDDHERVWLTCTAMEGTAEIRVNDIVLAKEHVGPFALNVTTVLKQHNRLEMIIAADSERGGLAGEVALEIRCSAYLDNIEVRRQADGTLEIDGNVVGTCDRPLELYGLADQSHVHYQLIDAHPDATVFHFSIPPRQPPVQQLRVDLVNVATVWYAWDRLLTAD